MDTHRDKRRRQTEDYVPYLPTPRSSEHSASPSTESHVPSNATATPIDAYGGQLPYELFGQQYLEYFPDTTADSQVILADVDVNSWHFGIDHYQGPHDAVCTACEGSGLLFGCQTCDNSYHSQCMNPPRDPNNVDHIWFCPHCYDAAMNIDSQSNLTSTATMGQNESTQNFAQSSTLPNAHGSAGYQTPASQATISPSFDRNEQAQIYQMPLRQQNIPSSVGLDYDFQQFTSQDPIGDFNQFNDLSGGFAQAHPPVTQQPLSYDRQSTTSSSITEAGRESTRAQSKGSKDSVSQSLGSFSTIEPDDRPASKPKSGKRQLSPSRKRSKYSALPAEVDDALAVIHNHLENAYKSKKSDEGSSDKIRTLEQRLKMQENELIMARQEISRLKDAVTNAQSGQNQNLQLKQENDQLKIEAKRRDEELKEWQRMLRTMLGSSIMPKGDSGISALFGTQGASESPPSAP